MILIILNQMLLPGLDKLLQVLVSLLRIPVPHLPLVWGPALPAYPHPGPALAAHKVELRAPQDRRLAQAEADGALQLRGLLGDLLVKVAQKWIRFRCRTGLTFKHTVYFSFDGFEFV